MTTTGKTRAELAAWLDRWNENGAAPSAETVADFLGIELAPEPTLPVGQRRRSPGGVEVVKTDDGTTDPWRRYRGPGPAWFTDDEVADPGPAWFTSSSPSKAEPSPTPSPPNSSPTPRKTSFPTRSPRHLWPKGSAKPSPGLSKAMPWVTSHPNARALKGHKMHSTGCPDLAPNRETKHASRRSQCVTEKQSATKETLGQ